jgi:hypothetical protein
MLAMACAVGGAILVPLYWRAAPLALRAQVMARLTGAIGLLRPVRQAEW